MTQTPWWASEDFWRKTAIFVTAGMFVVLVVLTFDTMNEINAGSDRVPDYSVINHRIYFDFDAGRGYQVPVVGEEAPLFGQKLSEEEAAALVSKGKLTVQARNCMNCHTLLGNGAYYAPDLTKSWLDQGWGAESLREELMFSFLKDPASNMRSFGSGRKMPNLNLSDEEARSVIAFLKWMSSIDTNGFPYRFRTIQQEARK
jgi:nitric oxide reductase subunit C